MMDGDGFPRPVSVPVSNVENEMVRASHLGQILIHLDVLTHKQVIEARRIQIEDDPPRLIGQILCELNYISREDLERALSIQKDITSV